MMSIETLILASMVPLGGLALGLWAFFLARHHQKRSEPHRAKH